MSSDVVEIFSTEESLSQPSGDAPTYELAGLSLEKGMNFCQYSHSPS
jgi:hypothetical protein